MYTHAIYKINEILRIPGKKQSQSRRKKWQFVFIASNFHRRLSFSRCELFGNSPHKRTCRWSTVMSIFVGEWSVSGLTGVVGGDEREGSGLRWTYSWNQQSGTYRRLTLRPLWHNAYHSSCSLATRNNSHIRPKTMRFLTRTTLDSRTRGHLLD